MVSTAPFLSKFVSLLQRLMRHQLTHLVGLIAFVAYALGSVSQVAAGGAASTGFVTVAPRAILMDAASGAILYQKNADDLAPPASMSKLMTLVVLFKAMKDGQIKPSDEFVMSVNAWRKGGAPSGTSAMFVPVNTKARVDELIRGIAIQSGNDAAIAIAEGMSGSEANFAKVMTDEARRIGLEKSTFANATGLDSPQHLMTARELALLARHLIAQYPDQYPVFAEREFLYRKHKFYNRNPLLSAGIGVDGLKTGHTKSSGYGLVASTMRDGRRLIAVLSGSESETQRKNDATKLLEWGFTAISDVKIFGDAEIIGHARVWGGQSMYVPLTGKGEVTIALPKLPTNQRLSAEIVYVAPLKPPVKRGDQVAMLRVTSTSSASSEIPLYAAEDVEPAGTVRRGLDTLMLMALRRLAL